MNDYFTKSMFRERSTT